MSTASKIDIVLEQVGALGRYQWIQVSLSGPGSMILACHMLAIVFHSVTPKHRCKIPGWGNDSYSTFSQLHNQSIYDWIPVNDDGQLDSCKIYSNNNGSVNNVTSDYCEEYVFDKSKYWGVTLNEEFGMICAESWASTIVKVIFTCGLGVGAIFMGLVADKLGRKLSLIGCMLTAGSFGVVAVFSVNYYMFAAMRFLVAVCIIGLPVIMNTIAMEITGPSARAYVTAYRSMFWCAGVSMLSLIAYYVQDWNWMQMTISVLLIIWGILLIFFLKETPHFLVTKGRYKEAEALFKCMAKMNGRTLPDNFMDEVKEGGESAVSEKLKVILKAPVLVRRTAILFYLWFTAGLCYYGMSFNVTNLTGSVFINNFLISGVAGVPNIFILLFSHRIGRKPSMMFSLLLGTVALLTVAFLTAYANLSRYGYIVTVVSMIGKIGIGGVFTFDYFWSSELYPTTLRTSLLGLSSFWARVGSILSPIIVDLNMHVETVFGSNLGCLIFGLIMLVGAVLAFLLPETNKQRIPETIAEANTFMTKDKAIEVEEEKADL